MLIFGLVAGSVYFGFIRVNPAVKDSLEKRTVVHLKVQGYSEDQYTLKVIKGLKVGGMKDYQVDVMFQDEPDYHYYYSEDPQGILIQEGWNGTKHIEY